MGVPLRFAVTSQNFRTITGHAGKARRFMLFEASGSNDITETGRLDLPIEMAFHGFDDRQPHPLDGVDLLLTAGAGDGFVMRMARRGIRVILTGESDPVQAIRGCFTGQLKPPSAPDDHDLENNHQCSCHS